MKVVSIKPKTSLPEELRQIASDIESGVANVPAFAVLLIAPVNQENFLDCVTINSVRSPSMLEVVGILSSAASMVACSSMEPYDEDS